MNSVVLNIMLYFLLLAKISLEKDFLRPKTVRIYRFSGTCPGSENASMYYSNIKLINVNRTFYVSMKAHLRSDIKNDMKLLLYLSRCTSRDALDSCETYNTIKINHFCKLLNAENMPWTDVINKFSPPIKCPIKKGTYEAKDTTFDGSAFNRFPVLNWYWKIIVNLLDEITSEILLCASLEGQIAPI